MTSFSTFVSPDSLRLTLLQARKKARELEVKDSDEVFDALEKLVFGLRATDPLNAALDRSGFW